MCHVSAMCHVSCVRVVVGGGAAHNTQQGRYRQQQHCRRDGIDNREHCDNVTASSREIVRRSSGDRPEIVRRSTAPRSRDRDVCTVTEHVRKKPAKQAKRAKRPRNPRLPRDFRSPSLRWPINVGGSEGDRRLGQMRGALPC